MSYIILCHHPDYYTPITPIHPFLSDEEDVPHWRPWTPIQNKYGVFDPEELILHKSVLDAKHCIAALYEPQAIVGETFSVIEVPITYKPQVGGL